VARGTTQEPAGDFVYQWSKDGVAIPGANDPTLVFQAVTAQDAGVYQVVVAPAAQPGFSGGVGSSPPGTGSPQIAALALPASALPGPSVPAPVGAVTSPVFDLEPVDHELFVTSTADSGEGSLRAAMVEAGTLSGIVGIRFQLPTEAPWLITLASPLPPVTTSLSILGPAEKPLALSGKVAHRPFFVDQGAALTLDNFTVQSCLAQGGNAPGGGGGAAGMGGAMFINNGDVTLRRMTFKSNQALGGASSPGSDGENGGGAGFSADSPATGGHGADGGLLGGTGGIGYLDGTATTDLGGGPALGDGGGGGAARGGRLTTPVASWDDNLPGGDATFGGGGGFSVGPQGGGGNCTDFGGGGGSSGGSAQGLFLPGSAGGAGGLFGGDGVPGDGVTGGLGGGGGGLGGAIFFRAGALKLVACTFLNNSAQGGAGAKGQHGLGKGGAIFIYPYDSGTRTPFALKMLEAQTYQGNFSANLVENPLFDNNNYYVAQTILALKRSPALAQLYSRYRLDLLMGVPWVPPEGQSR
jgi:hypothetical protein